MHVVIGMSNQKEGNAIEDDEIKYIKNTFRLEKENDVIDERMERYIKNLFESDWKKIL